MRPLFPPITPVRIRWWQWVWLWALPTRVSVDERVALLYKVWHGRVYVVAERRATG